MTCFSVERVERTSKTTAPSQGLEERSRPRSLDRQIPSKYTPHHKIMRYLKNRIVDHAVDYFFV